jgi:hypothetical protein
MPFLNIDRSLIWNAVKAVVPVIISAAALFISAAALFFALKDRRPRLDMRAKRGEWYNLRTTLPRGEIIFQGVIEIYNRSSRSNAIRGYSFEYKDVNGKWTSMESEQYMNTPNKDSKGDAATEGVFNRTPLPIGPYSAVESYVQALATMLLPKDGLHVRIVVEDLFAKRYRLEVRAIL